MQLLHRVVECALELWVERLQDVDLILISKPDFDCSRFQHFSTLCSCIVCVRCGQFSSHDWKMWANYGGRTSENISLAPRESSVGVWIPARSPRLESILFSSGSSWSLALGRQENSECMLWQWCTNASVARESFAIVPVPNVTCRLTTVNGTAYHDLPIDIQEKGN